MRLAAACSEVAAPDAPPQGFHHPPLAMGRFPALVSSSPLSSGIISCFGGLSMLKSRKPAKKETRTAVRVSFFAGFLDLSIDNPPKHDIIPLDKGDEETSAGKRPIASGGWWKPCGGASGAATSEQAAASRTDSSPLEDG